MLSAVYPEERTLKAQDMLFYLISSSIIGVFMRYFFLALALLACRHESKDVIDLTGDTAQSNVDW